MYIEIRDSLLIKRLPCNHVTEMAFLAAIEHCRHAVSAVNRKQVLADMPAQKRQRLYGHSTSLDDDDDGSLSSFGDPFNNPLVQRVEQVDGSNAQRNELINFHDGFSSDEAIDACMLCWEEQEYTYQSFMERGDSAQGKARSAMLKKVSDFRMEIFKLEKILVGAHNDAVVFKAMLHLRQKLIESYLDQHNIAHRKWTLEMLQTHYNVENVHRFDSLRDNMRELNDMRNITKKMRDDDCMYEYDPQSGERKFNAKVVDTRVRLSKRITELTKIIEDQMCAREKSTQADHSRLLKMLAAQSSTPEDRTHDPEAASAVDDLYNLGGV